MFNQHSGQFCELERAVHAAVEHGANAVKVQLFESQRLWGDTSRSYLELSLFDFKRLTALCERLGIELMATAFDHERLKWVLDAGVKTLKLASRTVTEDRTLCDATLTANLPTIVSCGEFAAQQLTDEFKKNPPFGKHDNIIYLFCVQKYPALLDDPLVRAISTDVDFSFFGGYSDHTPGISAALVALMRGAKYLEKHFSFDTALQSNTERGHFCSFTPQTLSSFKVLSREMQLLLT